MGLVGNCVYYFQTLYDIAGKLQRALTGRGQAELAENPWPLSFIKIHRMTPFSAESISMDSTFKTRLF
jgi:hypothetical protein